MTAPVSTETPSAKTTLGSMTAPGATCVSWQKKTVSGAGMCTPLSMNALRTLSCQTRSATASSAWELAPSTSFSDAMVTLG